MRAPLVTLVAGALVSSGAGAQALSSSTGAALAIAAPTEAQYDAGASGASGNYTISTTCTGTGTAGCRLFLQYGTNSQGQQVSMEYAVVSISSSQCRNVVANPNAWVTVQPTAVILNTNRGANCTASFRFRVSPLGWTTYLSPGPVSGAYRQRVIFVFTRP